VFGNKAMRRILGLKREAVTGGWRKVNNGQLHNFHLSPSNIRVNK
jgi:hypothetical protein